MSKILTFLGTGTSKGVPVVGCACPVCSSTNPMNQRLRTSALLHGNGQFLLIDAGPDFRMQALKARIHHLDGVLITHSHFDHVAGLDDLRALTEQGRHMPIYGRPESLDDIRHRFSYAFVETSQGSSRPLLELQSITEPFTIGETHIVPFDVFHGTWTITGYRIGDLAYITDASAIPDGSWKYLQNLDVLVLNALRFKPHPTHFSLGEALAVIAKVRPRRAFLVHLTHRFDHEKVNRQLPEGVQLAYDGLAVTLS